MSRIFNLRSLLRLFQRRLKLFLSVMGLVFVALVIASLVIPPKYTARASIKVDANQRTMLDTAAIMAGRSPDSAVVDTEVSVIKSREVAAEVVTMLGLTESPEFNPNKRKKLNILGSAERPKPQALQLEATVEQVLKRLSVQREGSSYIINVDFTASEPAQAARVANAFVAEYLDFSRRARAAAAQEQARLLTERLGDLEGEVRNADEALARYRASTGIVSGGEMFGTVNDQQITGIAAQLAQVESEAAAARSKARAAQAQVAKGDPEAVVEVLQSPVIADLRRQRTEVVREMAQINANYGPKHPNSIRVSDQLQGLDQQITSEARRIISGLNSDANAAEARAESLRSALAGLKAAQANNAKASVAADSLARDADAKRTIFNQVNQAAQQTTQMAQVGGALAQLVAAATEPARPSFPNKPIFALLGVMVGLVTGAAAVFAAEALDTGLRSVSDVEEGLGAPYLASVPRLDAGQLRAVGPEGRPWDFVLVKPISGFAEVFRGVRSSLQSARLPSAERGQVVLIASALPSEGKTVSAVSLARIMALSGDRVLLIDCDLRRNSLRGLLSKPPTAGLVEVLAGRATLEQAIQQDRIENLEILPLSNAAFTPRDLFGGDDSMRNLLDDLRKQYDQIVLDGPPLLVVTDARVLSTLADQVVLAVRWAKTAVFAVESALANLRADGAPLRGVVLTQVDTASRSQMSEYDAAYYYRDYGRYYQE